MSDPWRTAQLIAAYSCVHAVAHWAQNNTGPGKSFKTFCQTWRADGWLHGICCSITVFIWAVVAIFSLGMGLHYLGI